MIKIEDKKYNSISKLSKRLGVSRTTIYKNDLHNKIPHIKVGQRNIYSESGIQYFLDLTKR